MRLTQILDRLKELKYEPDHVELVITNGDLQKLAEYITVLEKQSESLARERNSYFQQLTQALDAKPVYTRFDTKG